MNPLDAVAEFHRAFDHPINDDRQPLDSPLAVMRLGLITEEHTELRTAIAANDRVGIVDALQDLKYVVCGATLSLGLGRFDTTPLDHATLCSGDEYLTEDLEQLDRDIAALVDAFAVGDAPRAAYLLEDIYCDCITIAAGYGFDDEAHFAAVHAANMRKLGPDGRPIYREDGKVLKPASWTGPDADHQQLLLAA